MIEKSYGNGQLVYANILQHPLEALCYGLENVLNAYATSYRDAWGIEQVKVPIEKVDPLQWLYAQNDTTKIFWGDRESDFSVAAIGQADCVKCESGDLEDLRVLEKRIAGQKQVRYYGGLRFDSDRNASEIWHEFGTSCFILPRIELQVRQDKTFLVCNLVLPRDFKNAEILLKQIQGLNMKLQSVPEFAGFPISRTDAPIQKQWNAVVEEALEELGSHVEFDKVVLARMVSFKFADFFDRFLLFNSLYASTPNCFHFYFETDGNQAFLGATPERLFRRTKHYVESEAVAGTGRRGNGNESDEAFAEALLLSEKDQREHEYVRQSLIETFSGLCKDMYIEPRPSLLDLNMGRHLKSKFWGILRKGVTDIDVLGQLHPTSAVGGYPSKKAIEAIERLEPFDRGWYAGPIGWLSEEGSEFAVAIRSAHASDTQLSLFSGAGIVQGSLPEKEWEEIEQKISDYIRVLGLDQKSSKY